MENSIKGRRIGDNLHLRGGCARAVPAAPPLTPLLHRVAAKQHCQNFAKHKIVIKFFLNFTKSEENFMKHEI